MEAAAEMLEAKFQKAESDLNLLARKLELRCQDSTEGNSRRNPLELLQRVKAVKEEYRVLVQETAEIQQAQAEAMDYFRSQLPIVFQALQQLQDRVAMEGTDQDKAKVEQLQSLLGIEPPRSATEAASCPVPADPQAKGQADSPTLPAAGNAQELGCQEPSPPLGVEDPVAVRTALRQESSEFIEVSQEEFQSVSELVRGRVKLSEVNSVYRKLYEHFKEEKNSAALLPKEMHKIGLRVTGATGQAKLKVLRALKLLTISSKEEVKLT